MNEEELERRPQGEEPPMGPYTMHLAYHDIAQGHPPWMALGNFLNAFFLYNADNRLALVHEPIEQGVDLKIPPHEAHRWAIFCAASVEYLCLAYALACPSWVYQEAYTTPLNEPWFFSPVTTAYEAIRRKTPTAFARRNIFCGNTVLATKYTHCC